MLFPRAYADSGLLNLFEKTLMSGELTKAHAKYEKDCKLCHKFFEKSSQNDLCIDCHDHKNIADDIKDKRGLHGKIPDINKRECKTCHREHLGRDADIVMLDKQTFDHDLTDFALRDNHRNVRCENCHKPEKKYHQAPGECFDCHKSIEPHKEKLGKKCGSCHHETNWRDFHFDHSQTKFKLKGRHKGVQCRNCHPLERFRNTPKECYACHRNDDRHDGLYDKKCEKCHSTEAWRNSIFDHDKDTEFKLIGRHKDTACVLCHKDNPYKNKTKDTCHACHKFDDEHKGSFGEKCQDCHTPKEWSKKKFNHDKTDFPLRGTHKEVACKDCHPGDVYKEVSTKCFDCHRHNDAHNGSLGKACNDCHAEKAWIENVKFDHNLTSFPLLGSHIALACEACHSSADFKAVKLQCNYCHHKSDIHKQRLGPNCGYCHLANDWKVWYFDHDTQTDFKLKGSHAGKDCMLCHREPVKGEFTLSMSCYSCHAADDRHDGGYGHMCDRCHNEKAFDEVKITM